MRMNFNTNTVLLIKQSRITVDLVFSKKLKVWFNNKERAPRSLIANEKEAYFHMELIYT